MYMGLVDNDTYNSFRNIDIDGKEHYYSGLSNEDNIGNKLSNCFDSKFDFVFKLVLNKKYRIDLSKYGFNKYSFIDEQVFIQSDIIKRISDLIILFPDININDYIIKLVNFINNSINISELYNKMDNYLISLLIDIGSKEDIISYIDDKYYEKGYCYYGYNSSFTNNLLSNGLSFNKDVVSKLKFLNSILEKYGIKNAMTYNWSYQDKKSFFITDNFGASYYYSLLSPVLLSRFVANGEYTNGDKYDRSVYYNRDNNGVINNVILLLKEFKVSDEDIKIVLSLLKELLYSLFDEKENLSIAIIDRCNIKRNVYSGLDNSLSIENIINYLLKPRFELDRHENTVFDSNILKFTKIRNYTNLFK